jgi:hypothetical protein
LPHNCEIFLCKNVELVKVVLLLIVIDGFSKLSISSNLVLNLIKLFEIKNYLVIIELKKSAFKILK